MRKLKKRIVLPTICLLVLLGLIVISGDWLLTTIHLNNSLTKQSRIIAEQNRRDYRKVRQLILEKKVLEAEKEQLRLEAYKDRLKDFILLKYKRWGMLQENKYITPQHIKDCVNYCFKYYNVAGERQLDGVDLPLMMLAICYHESNFNPTLTHRNDDKTTDYGITQINDVCLKSCISELPKDLRSRNIKTDTETNICGRFIWIKHRRGYGWSWLGRKFTSRGWDFYAELKNCK